MPVENPLDISLERLLTYWAVGPCYRVFQKLLKVCLYSCSLAWFEWFGLVWFYFDYVLLSYVRALILELGKLPMFIDKMERLASAKRKQFNSSI